MHDFSCTNPKDMYYKILADRVRYFKEDEEGVLTMCREMENMRKAERIEIAKRMLASGKLTYEDIAAFTDLTLEEIEALAVQKTRVPVAHVLRLPVRGARHQPGAHAAVAEYHVRQRFRDFRHAAYQKCR